MGNPKQKWTAEEEEALRAGVAKHGAGKWKNIQRDPEFNHLLFARSNIDLKDKWRNLSVASGQGPRDKSKSLKSKVNNADAPALSMPITQTSTPITPLPLDASAEVAMKDSSRPLPEGNNTAKLNAMIYEALSSLKEPNGSDCSAIAAFIEQRQEVPQNFKRHLSSRLRRLVLQDKLEKQSSSPLPMEEKDLYSVHNSRLQVQNCYRMKRDTVDAKNFTTKTIESVPRHVPSRQIQGLGNPGDTVEKAAISAARSIAEAENKSVVALDAATEAERVARMAEDQDSLLQFALECAQQSNMRTSTQHSHLLLLSLPSSLFLSGVHGDILIKA